MLNTASLADKLTIATHEFTTNWHPIHSTSYPATLLTRLTTEHFLVKACIGNKKPGTSATMRQEFTGNFLRMCLSVNKDVGSTYLPINNNTINRVKCSNLSADDIALTLKHMRKDTNDYQIYDLRFNTRSKTLSINNPARPSAEVLRQALSFPIIRQGKADRVFGRGTQYQYNKITAGPYKVQAFKSDIVHLKPRNPRIATKVTMSDIYLKSFSVRQQLVQSLQNQKVDVALNLPISMRVNPKTYQQVTNSELNNIAYVGFNFGTQNQTLQNLYQSQEFRKVLTQSIWANKVIRNKLDVIGTTNPEGNFYGEGFEPISRHNTTLWHYTVLPKKIKFFLQYQYIKDQNEEVKILINPSMNFIFTSTQLKVFINELNSMWQGSLNFTVINPGTPAKYLKELKKGHFDMLMDTFFFGKNPYKPLYFLLENHETNLLQNNVIEAKNIKEWLSLGMPGLEKFRKKMLSSYPIAIIGSFTRRDYISKKIEIPQDECPSNTIPIPYTFMPKWTHR